MDFSSNQIKLIIAGAVVILVTGLAVAWCWPRADAISAALLITISTSGDFQRKWQANRVAASELERTAYDFLENKNTNAVRKYFSDIGDILHKRNLSIIGNVDRKTPEPAKEIEP